MNESILLAVSEVFYSIQGEGVSAGLPAVFVRLQGCTVGCTWCDTRYSWDPARGETVPLAGLLAQVRAYNARRAVVTGGEPLEAEGFGALVRALKEAGMEVEVETAGVAVPPDVPVDQWNVSLKLANSGVPEERRLRPEAIRRFVALGAWFKFVIDRPEDVEEVRELETQFALPPDRILLMPEGMSREQVLQKSDWILAECKRTGYRYSPRLQILLWGPRRGV